MTDLKIGVVGYSGQKFDEDEAKRLISELFDKVIEDHKLTSVTVVSGLTWLGIPGLAYEEAARRGWKTVGIACIKAEKYTCYPVNSKVVKKEWLNWGDESPEFLRSIDVIVRIGGGKQSHDEVGAFKKAHGKDKAYERELAAK